MWKASPPRMGCPDHGWPALMPMPRAGKQRTMALAVALMESRLSSHSTVYAGAELAGRVHPVMIGRQGDPMSRPHRPADVVQTGIFGYPWRRGSASDVEEPGLSQIRR